MNPLNKALAKGFVLAVFEERYGGGWAALVAPDMQDAQWVENMLIGPDIQAVEMQSYLGTAGTMFPISETRPATPSEAISSLNRVLSRIPDDMWGRWYDRVIEAYEAMRNAEHGSRNNPYFLGIARKSGKLVIIE